MRSSHANEKLECGSAALFSGASGTAMVATVDAQPELGKGFVVDPTTVEVWADASDTGIPRLME